MRFVHLQSSAYTAVVDLARGANCVSLCHRPTGAHLLRELPTLTAEPDNPFLYGMPILFPANRISGGSFDFDGRTYTFPINEPATGCHLHGELHGMPFVLAEVTEERAVCVYTAEAGEYLAFPHAFTIKMTYHLTDRGMTHTVTVMNCSTERMPCLLGFHTTFNALPLPDSRAEDIRVLVEIGEEYARDMHTCLPTGDRPAFDAVSTALASGEFCPMGQPISRHYRAGGGEQMHLRDCRQGVTVCYLPDHALGFRMIYNGNADGFICLEPQIALVNSPNSPIDRTEAGFDWLEPGETRTFVSEISLKTA